MNLLSWSFVTMPWNSIVLGLLIDEIDSFHMSVDVSLLNNPWSGDWECFPVWGATGRGGGG
jgi:hypothetical protein